MKYKFWGDDQVDQTALQNFEIGDFLDWMSGNYDQKEDLMNRYISRVAMLYEKLEKISLECVQRIWMTQFEF